MQELERNLRRGQLASIHGPGAMVDVGDESFVVCGLELWSESSETMKSINLPRLAVEEGWTDIKQPANKEELKARKKGPAVRIRRFPEWLFCQSCRRMELWTLHAEKTLGPREVPVCSNPTCQGRRPRALVPMRFVRVCTAGHLSDVDWHRWCHTDPRTGERKRCGRDPKLCFESKAQTGLGLESLFIQCDHPDCKARRSLAGLIKKKDEGEPCLTSQGLSHYKWHGIGGRQPWERFSSVTEPCDAPSVVVQRGDSNVHFPSMRSALDIPEETSNAAADAARSRDRLRGHPAVKVLLDLRPNLPEALLRDMAEKVRAEHGFDPAILHDVLFGQPETSPKGGEEDTDMKLRRQEFPVLVSPEDFRGHPYFEGTSYVPGNAFHDVWRSVIRSVSMLSRLREVRAYRGFNRVEPSERIVKASLKTDVSWGLGYEVFGEGIFLQFDREWFESWKSALGPEAMLRQAVLAERMKDGAGFLPEPRLECIAIHTLSHALMRQLCFDCGYAASSLRERIYVIDEEMLGLLIYTADGDSEGTLGGLVRQGESTRLASTLMRAASDLAWCSADPLCLESDGHGLFGLNRAACHACSLVSETSCEVANVLLDRRLLIGGPGVERGLIEDLISEIGVTL